MSKEEKLHLAQQPTLKRLRELATRTSAPVAALLLAIAAHYCDRDGFVFMIRRQAGATEWQMKLFKRELGITVWSLIRQCRKDTASILMRDTSLALDKIASLVGYKSADAFRRCFKELTGLKPSTMKACLRRISLEQRALADELLSWYFWVRYHRRELHEADLRAALAFLRDHIGTT